MDYLENKIEIFQTQMGTWEKEKAKLIRQLETSQDKLHLIKENKDREIKDLGKKIDSLGNKLKQQVEKTQDTEHKLF